MKVKETMATWRKSQFSYLTVTPILVGGVIIIASFIAGASSARNIETVQVQAVDKQLRENSLLIQNTFNLYEQIVRSGVGHVSSAPVNRESWGKFVEAYDIPSRYPAISQMSVSRIVQPSERESYLAQLSEQYAQPIQLRGAVPPDSAVNVLSYVSPEQPDTINSVGFNIWTDPRTERATQRATDTNSVVMTDQTELLQNAKGLENQEWKSFLMYAPYYQAGTSLTTVDQRREAVLGHVFASFKTNEVFRQVFEHIDTKHVAIMVTTEGGAGENDAIVYSSQPSGRPSAIIERHQVVNVYGQAFTINYAFDSKSLVSTTQLNAPLYTMLFGSFIGLLVGTVTFFFLRGRHHQVLLDKERDIARAKDELLSLASHQLRTPATGVKQYMGMVLQGFAGPISETQEEMLAKAYASNERQLQVINDILHLAKLDLGRIVLARTKFDLSELVHDVIEEQEQELRKGELAISTKLIRQAPIYADKHMLRMVVENLLSNAIKYTDAGGRVLVRLQRGDNGYYLTVRDTGVGIASADMSQLFKQFSRIPNPRSHLVTGTGVGLYLAKHLTRLHDGDIVVESKLGRGSSFIVYIPKNSEKL